MKIQQRRKIKKITSGLFSSMMDVAIFTFGFIVQGSRGKDPFTNIINSLSLVKRLNSKTFKRAVYNAQHKGYLARKKDFYQITELGRQRLNRLFPVYDEKRPWDGRLYLITYDIPEKQRANRDLIRSQLKKIGCGLLQKSVWLTPYNPTGVLIDFIKKNALAGLVLISDLKAGGFIGGKQAPQVIEKIYSLKKLNNQYREFCLAVEEKKLKKDEVVLSFLSILKNDPQLPFELLPDNWWGRDAFDLYKKELKKIT